MDDVETLTFLLKANINNRKWTPLDYARAIYAYTEKIQPHKSFAGRSRDDIADFFTSARLWFIVTHLSLK